MRQVLKDDGTEMTFSLSGGIQQAMISDHSGGEIKMQVRAPDGEWMDTDVIFNDNGIQAFHSASGVAYRFTGQSGSENGYVSGISRINV